METLVMSQAHPVSVQSSVPKKVGSQLIRYDVAARNYDYCRRPIGIKSLRNAVLAACDDLKLPSDGNVEGAAFCCGTGAHEVHLMEKLRFHDGRRDHGIHLIDASDGMLAQANAKFGDSDAVRATHKLDVVEGDWDLPKLHWATVIQAIHHLDSHDNEFPRMKKLFAKVRGALVEGGSFLILTSTPEQAHLPRWYLNVLTGKVDPELDPAHHYSREFPRREMVEESLAQAGFQVAEVKTLQGPYIRPKVHNGNNPEMLFSRLFRDGESFFDIAKKVGLEESFDAELRKMMRQGTLKKHRKESEARRAKMGVAYLLRACAV